LIAAFSLRFFVADGDPDGLRIVDKSNWIGKALVFPRPLPLAYSGFAAGSMGKSV
jgi:hypothetical protein